MSLHSKYRMLPIRYYIPIITTYTYLLYLPKYFLKLKCCIIDIYIYIYYIYEVYYTLYIYCMIHDGQYY